MEKLWVIFELFEHTEVAAGSPTHSLVEVESFGNELDAMKFIMKFRHQYEGLTILPVWK